MAGVKLSVIRFHRFTNAYENVHVPGVELKIPAAGVDVTIGEVIEPASNGSIKLEHKNSRKNRSEKNGVTFTSIVWLFKSELLVLLFLS